MSGVVPNYQNIIAQAQAEAKELAGEIDSGKTPDPAVLKKLEQNLKLLQNDPNIPQAMKNALNNAAAGLTQGGPGVVAESVLIIKKDLSAL